MYELKEDLSIENMIYEIRGKQVMLDCDLAKLYNVETKRINEAVKNNPYKFPERFSFFLNDFEFTNLRSKFSTSSWEESLRMIFRQQIIKKYLEVKNFDLKIDGGVYGRR